MDQASSDLAAARNIHGSCSRQIRTGCRERPLTSTTHHPPSPDQTTKIYANGSHPPRPSGKGSSDLETSPLDCSARDASHMASSAVPPLLEAPFQAKTDTGESSSRDHCVDQGDGKQQSTSSERNGSVADYSSWGFVSANARSRSTCDTCAHLDQEDRTGRPSSATTLRVAGPVIFYRRLPSSFGRSLPSSSLN